MHEKNPRRVIAKGVGEQDLHMVTLCEVGGHKQGLKRSMVRAQDLVSEVLSRHYKATSCQAYMATWQATTEPADDTGVTLTLLAGPEVVELSSPALEPQLVVMVFAIAAAGHPDKHGLLISGNLHIRTPKDHTTTTQTRKRITKATLQALEQRASTASSGASQPTAPVLVLTGDVNLTKAEGETIVQMPQGEPSVYTQWQVLTAGGQLSGDIMFVKGTTAHQTNFNKKT